MLIRTERKKVNNNSPKFRKILNLLFTGICLSFIFLIVINAEQKTAYAGGWVYVDDSDPSRGVYWDDNASGNMVDDVDVPDRQMNGTYTPTGGFITKDAGIYKTSSETIKEESTKPSKAPGWGEKLIIDLFKGPAEMINKLENSWHMTLDNIVYGRITYAGTNYYQFELVSGNPYGIAGGYMYNIFRLICLVILWCIFIAQVTKTLIFTNSSMARAEMKSSFGKLLTITIALYIMPYAMDIAIYIRDVILYLIHGMSGSVGMMRNGVAVSNNGLGDGITSVFATLAGDSWIWAFIYLGSTFLALYFAYAYVGVALSFTIYFILFPIVCIMAYFDKNILNSWVKNVLAALLVPIIDGFLLVIPVLVYNIVNGYSNVLAGILTIICVMIVIPSRRTVGQLFGLSMGGMGSMAAAAMGGYALMRGAAGIVRNGANAIQHFRNAKEANDEAKMYGALSSAEKEGQGSFDNLTSESMAEIGSPDLSAKDFSAGGGAGGFGGFGGGAGGFGGQAKGINMALGNKIGDIQRDKAQNLKQAEKYDSMGLSADAIQSRQSAEENQAEIDNLQKLQGMNNLSAISADNSLAEKRQQILEKRANISNYNSPQLAGISNERRAELARKRARSEMLKGVGSSVGTVAGMGYGAAASSFFGPTASVLAMAAGGSVGGFVGNAAGSGAYQVTNAVSAAANTRPAKAVGASVRAAGSTAYTKIYTSPAGNDVRSFVNAGREVRNNVNSRFDGWTDRANRIISDNAKLREGNRLQ